MCLRIKKSSIKLFESFTIGKYELEAEACLHNCKRLSVFSSLAHVLCIYLSVINSSDLFFVYKVVKFYRRTHCMNTLGVVIPTGFLLLRCPSMLMIIHFSGSAVGCGWQLSPVRRTALSSSDWMNARARWPEWKWPEIQLTCKEYIANIWICSNFLTVIRIDINVRSENKWLGFK